MGNMSKSKEEVLSKFDELKFCLGEVSRLVDQINKTTGLMPEGVFKALDDLVGSWIENGTNDPLIPAARAKVVREYNNLETDLFVLAEENQLFINQFWGEKYLYEEAVQKAQAYANKTGNTVYLWNYASTGYHEAVPAFQIDPQIEDKPIYSDLDVGSILKVEVNRGVRDAEVLARIGSDFLAEYLMPNGTSALQLLTDGCKLGEPVSYYNLPKKWLQAMIEEGSIWVANPQQARNKRKIGTPEEEMKTRFA